MSTKRPKSSDGAMRAQRRSREATPDAATTDRKSNKKLGDDAAQTMAETAGLPWATMSRLTFLEESIFWTDSVNRKDLISQFGISEQQASGDLTR